MPTWNTASDWDNASSESGVAHENVSYSDHDDAGSVRRGYHYTDIMNSGNCLVWSHCDGGDNNTIKNTYGNDGYISNDVTSNASGGDIYTGLYHFDGGAYAKYGIDTPSQLTAILWADVTGDGVDDPAYYIDWGINNTYYGGFTIEERNGRYYTTFGDGSNNYRIDSGVNATTGTQMLAATYDSSGNITLYKDKNKLIDANKGNGSLSNTGRDLYVSTASWGSGHGVPMDLWNFGGWNTAFSESEIYDYYDILNNNSGTLTSNWKSP